MNRTCRVWCLGLCLATVVIGGIGGVVLERLNVIESVRAQLSGERESSRRSSVLPDTVRGHLALFILAGQSNMVGQGAARPADQTPVPGSWTFGNDYRWTPTRAPIDDPTGQVDPVSQDRFVGVGPGLSFARTVRAECPNLSIGLIPCAKGGSSIEQWQPSRGEHTLYGSCLKRTRAAETVGEVRGILFYQGETDALDPNQHSGRSPSPYAWKDEFETLIQAWRKDLDAAGLPVVFAQIASHRSPDARFPYWDTVQAQQAAVSLPAATMVRTEGLPLRDDVHLTRKGYETVGRRMAEAWTEVARHEACTGGAETSVAPSEIESDAKALRSKPQGKGEP